MSTHFGAPSHVAGASESIGPRPVAHMLYTMGQESRKEEASDASIVSSKF